MAAPTFSWLGGEIHAEVVLGVVALAGAYTWATVRSRRPTSLGPPMAFFGGCAALLLALNGPLHDLSDGYLFSAHMVQHLVLTLIVPPLLLLGTPTWMADRLLGPWLRPVVTRWFLATATRPVPALAIYTAALVLWHLPAVYDLA